MNNFCHRLYLFIIILQTCHSLDTFSEIKEIYKRSGDVNFVYLEDCEDVFHQEARTTRINAAIWTVDRLNVLEITAPLTLGLEIYDVCNKSQYYDITYQIFKQQEESFTIGLITSKSLPTSVQKFCDVLNIETKMIQKNHKQAIWATVQLLTALKWYGNLSVVVQEHDIIEDVLHLTRKAWLCITNVVAIKDLEMLTYSPNGQYVIMADGYAINKSLMNSSTLKLVKKIIFVVLDGSRLENIPEGSYLVNGYNEDIILDSTKQPKIVPSPIFFDIANPFVAFTKSFNFFIHNHCNNNTDFLLCAKEKYKESNYLSLSNSELLSYLEIQPLESKFNYEMFVSENFESDSSEPLQKLAVYNVLEETLIQFDDNVIVSTYFEKFANNSDDNSCKKTGSYCEVNCLNFWSPKTTLFPIIKVRCDAWVFAILTVSLLGILFCIAIMLFLIYRLCKKQIFEGNPTLTVLLLIVVILMYFSIVPFALDGEDDIKPTIILFRSFSLALPYAAAFSLILSRVILLATVSKEVGFMSHVAGVVQSFLTIFIFGVQCALSLQILGRCGEIFHTIYVLYLLSYNILLLILLLCITPKVAKSQRNYREGRYFLIATILIACNWCCWIPSYVMLGEYWKDPMLCIGLVVTASIMVGTIFIPRTYLITVSAARDRFTSALPSLAANTLDIYHTVNQPVYDCINVTAINNHNMNAADKTSNQEDVESIATPSEPGSTASTVNPDKLTRF